MGVSFEDVAAVEALHRGVIPPTANDPSVDPALVRKDRTSFHARHTHSPFLASLLQYSSTSKRLSNVV